MRASHFRFALEGPVQAAPVLLPRWVTGPSPPFFGCVAAHAWHALMAMARLSRSIRCGPFENIAPEAAGPLGPGTGSEARLDRGDAPGVIARGCWQGGRARQGSAAAKPPEPR